MIIDLSTVKTYLGLTANTYDAQITAFSPDVDAMVKEYCNEEFSDDFWAETTNGSDTIAISSYLFTNYAFVNGIWAEPKPIDFKVGDLVTGTGIPVGTYIIRKVFSGSVLTALQLSANATASGQVTLIRGINRGYNSAISKIIAYMISKNNMNAESGIQSKSVGPLSISYSKSAVNQKYGVPESLLNCLPKKAKMA